MPRDETDTEREARPRRGNWRAQVVCGSRPSGLGMSATEPSRSERPFGIDRHTDGNGRGQCRHHVRSFRSSSGISRHGENASAQGPDRSTSYTSSPFARTRAVCVSTCGLSSPTPR
jgi:hypothetical protein